MDTILRQIELFFQLTMSQLSEYFASMNFTKVWDILLYNPREPLLFSSGAFLFVFLGFMLAYFAFRKRLSARLLFVTLFSYYFFYKSSGFYFLLLALVTVSDFLIARRVHAGSRRKPWVALSLLVNLGMLAYFKYTNFFAGMVSQMIGGNFQPWDIFLPVGISFYTFKTISYVVDVYRGRMKPMESLLDYASTSVSSPLCLPGLSSALRNLVHRYANRCISRRRCLPRVSTSSSSDSSRKLSFPIISRRTSSTASSTILPSFQAVKCFWASMATAYKYTATSRAIRTWPSASRFYSGSSFR